MKSYINVFLDGSYIVPEIVKIYYKKRADKVKLNEMSNKNLESLKVGMTIEITFFY